MLFSILEKIPLFAILLVDHGAGLAHFQNIQKKSRALLFMLLGSFNVAGVYLNIQPTVDFGKLLNFLDLGSETNPVVGLFQFSNLGGGIVPLNPLGFT